MKQFLLKSFDQLVERAFIRIRPKLGFVRYKKKSFHLLDAAFVKAALESADYYEAHMLTARSFLSRADLLRHAVSIANPGGSFLEFGVAGGKTITLIAKHHAGPIFGFDSFEGLPEDWRTGKLKGCLATSLPNVPSNVTLIRGLFSDTLPDFAANNSAPISFIHIDCVLYSSTKCIFDQLGEFIGNGCVIVFDEYLNYPGWRQHEFKAFQEFIASRNLAYRYLGFVPSHQQVCVVIE